MVTAASFPTPDLIRRSNNPALWDQQGPNAGLEQYHTPIGDDTMIDAFGPGLRSEGSHLSGVTGRLTGGTETPASRISARLGEIIEHRIATEAPGREVLANQVRLPDGSTITGNTLLRGKAAADQYGLPRPVEGFCCTLTGRLDDRRTLQREAFGILADLETQRAAGKDLLGDPAARRAFVAAEYYLYQGPEYQRGGDATIRVLLATSHTRLFGAPPKLPQDIDVMAYAAGQDAFHHHVEHTQTILPPAAAHDVSSPEAAAEKAVRTRPRGLERD
ncbi:hypothetical protein [Kribbella swartbergensis]